MLANLATALFEHGRITTTEAKAKRLRPLAERLITFAKRGDLHARRQVLSVVRDKEVVHNLFADIAPQYAERAGGYTRVTKIGPRKGDNAPMAVIELVEGRTVAQEALQEAERARSTRFARRRRPTGATAEAAAELAASSPTAAAVAAEAQAGAEPEAVASGEETPVPAEGDVEASAEPAEEQVAVPAEGGDTAVVTEAAGEGEADTSASAEQAGPTAQTEDDAPQE